MRTFKTESIWDAEEQQWVEVYFVNNQEVDMETFNEEMDREVNPPEEEFDDNEESPGYQEDVFDVDGCKGCEEYQECFKKYGDFDEESEEMCFCEECQKEREHSLITECLDMVFDPVACVDCTIDKVVQILYKFKELGYLEARAELREFLDS